MKFKFLGIILLAIFAITGTACKSGKSCKGGGWYGNRNLSYHPTTVEQQPLVGKIDNECVNNRETCALTKP